MFTYSLAMELPRPSEFTPTFCDTIVDALRGCYRWVGPRLRPARGLDERWAGLTISMLVGPAFTSAFGEVTGVTVRRAGLVHEVVAGRNELRTNKLGRTADQSVASSFPRASRAVAEMAAANRMQESLGLPDVYQQIQKHYLVQVPTPTRWVIGHMGSAAAGLQAVYLCAPLKSVDGAITEWLGWIPIYRADGLSGEAAPPPGLPEDPLPPAVDIEPAAISLLDEADDVKSRDAG